MALGFSVSRQRRSLELLDLVRLPRRHLVDHLMDGENGRLTNLNQLHGPRLFVIANSANPILVQAAIRLMGDKPKLRC